MAEFTFSQDWADICIFIIYQIIEVRKDSDPFFEVAEVFLDDNFIYFFPKQKAVPTKKMERNTYKIMDVSSMHIIRGKRISEGKKTIPVDIINKYKIKYGEMVSCKQMSDGKWYGFKPIGRDLLSFTDGINHLDTVALTVVNEAELKKYLYEVKQKLFQSKKMFYEFEGFKLGEFLEVVKISDE